MIPEDQKDVFDLLANPASYGAGVDHVEQIHTHISAVFLAGDKAYKLKRAVDLGFVDFSTREKRRAACEKEVAVNAIAAPDIYIGVKPITRDPSGALVIGGTGTKVDTLVVMNRFDQETLFDGMVSRGELDRHEMMDLGLAVARFHGAAEVDKDRGGAPAMDGTIRGNQDSFTRYTPAVFAPEDVARLTDASMAALKRVATLLDERRAAGRVKRCHGDLHLRNICLIGGKPTLFDAIEFNDDFAIIDVLYDMAFLVMDLDSRGFRRLANIAFNHYLPHTKDWDGLPALPLFLSCRAAIRSHVAAAMAGAQTDDGEADRLREEALSYFKMAEAYLLPQAPKLVAVGGLSGSGKSRMGRELAPFIGVAPGAVVLRTDMIRKRLMGVEVEDKLGPDGYTPEMTRRTYDALYEQVGKVLASGQSVIADAVFAREEERCAIEAVAKNAGVPFFGLWLEAPPEIMAERITSRIRNPSDATIDVLNKQMDMDIGKLTWEHINSGGERDATLRQGRDVVGV